MTIEYPRWGKTKATRADFLKHARKRADKAPVGRLQHAFGLKAATLEGIADGLAKHDYDWDKAIMVVEYIWAHT